MVGVLAVVAIPRMYDRSDFENRGFVEATLSGLTLARKTAIVQQRNVCVNFTDTGVNITIASRNDRTAACDLPFAGPVGPAPYSIKAPGSAAYRIAPDLITFDPQGRPSAGHVIAVQDSATNIVLEEETGYAHK
jgi:MSHA pilin protein MshC